MSKGTQRARIGEVREALRQFEGPTSQSIRRADEITGHFQAFLRNAFDVDFVDQVTADQAITFIRAKSSVGEPAIATMHMRRTALRMLFRIARLEFGCEGDPTIDLRLPARTTLSARALTDDEIALGRSYSLHTLTVTRQPAAWALCEAGAVTAELGHITVHDIDLDHARVWLHGSRKRVDRWAVLDEWGATQIERRIQQVGSGHLIYRGKGSEQSQHMSCCNAIRDTMIRAGLNDEPDVQPPSIAAWAGLRVYEQTGSIEKVAERLGIRSLDAAAHFVGRARRS